jgi:hypothetical protein
MAALTNYIENKLIDHIFRTNKWTPTGLIYVGLILSGTDFEAGTVSEVSSIGTGYARVARAPLDANWTAPVTNGTTSNVASIQFPGATADWGTITYYGIWDAATGGNLLIYAPLTSARTITNGTTPSFAATALVFQIDN